MREPNLEGNKIGLEYEGLGDWENQAYRIIKKKPLQFVKGPSLEEVGA